MFALYRAAGFMLEPYQLTKSMEELSVYFALNLTPILFYKDATINIIILLNTYVQYKILVHWANTRLLIEIASSVGNFLH